MITGRRLGDVWETSGRRPGDVRERLGDVWETSGRRLPDVSQTSCRPRLSYPMESYKIPPFMILGTKNASGGPKIDIGGPCPKPYINITFWGVFFAPEAENQFWSGKVRFGREF